MPGQQIGHYEIRAKLGQGGMGEVFRARDTRLERDVALKFLPRDLEQDETARQRFVREAKAAAAIDHPYICSIYEVGQTDEGADYIAMEYVAGQTLQEKLEDGPLPLEKALPLVIEAAEALEKAHNAGFLHRDLKPANLMLTPEGHVKVMDFGLAKRLLGQDSSEQGVTTGLTRQGSTLGTLAYMSPEQLRGEELDARSDLFSFGVVLYETLTGVNPFRRKQPMETASAILNETAPPPGRYLGEVPYLLERILSKLLSKEKERRYQLIHELKTDLEDLLREGGSETQARTLPIRHSIWPWTTGFLIVLLGVTLWLLWPQPEPPEPPRRLSIEPGEGASFSFDALGGAGVLSPDESMIVFLGRAEGGSNQLYLRRLDRLEATPLPGTEGAVQAVFSPDGHWIAFRADRELKRIAVKGGSAVTLCSTGAAQGISWGEDGSIVFAPGRTGGLSRVPAVGGTPEPLTILAGEEGTHRWPQVLPGGQAVLFTAHSKDGQLDEARIVAQRLPDGERKVLWQGGYHGRYLPTGHLVYIHQGTLFAAPFDLDALEIQGQPAPILEKVRSDAATGFSGFTFSDRGSLLYVPGEANEQRFQLEWLNPEGGRQELSLQPADFRDFRLSPSGKLLALEIYDGTQWDLWIYNIESDTLTRLTFDPADDERPVWSPSGRSIVFASSRAGASNLYLKPVDGSGEVQRLTESENNQFAASWHPEGRWVAFWESTPENAQDIRVLELEGDDQSGWVAREAVTFLSTPDNELRPQFSPDGNWLAYFSNESGRWEIYVRAFPGPGGRWQISTEGGWQTRWLEASQQLFFEWSGRLFVSQYRVQGTSFLADRWVELPNGSLSTRVATCSFDLHPDGRILVRKRPGEVAGSGDVGRLVLFENFFDYIKQQVPAP